MPTSQHIIDFPIESSSPINRERLNSDNGKVLNYILTGKRINMVVAGNELGVKTLHSRIANVRKFLFDMGHELKSRFIKVGESTMKEYWLEEKDIQLIITQLNKAA